MLLTLNITAFFAGAEEALERGGSERQLFNLVLEWARTNVDESKPKVELLTEEVRLNLKSICFNAVHSHLLIRQVGE